MGGVHGPAGCRRSPGSLPLPAVVTLQPAVETAEVDLAPVDSLESGRELVEFNRVDAHQAAPGSQHARGHFEQVADQLPEIRDAHSTAERRIRDDEGHTPGRQSAAENELPEIGASKVDADGSEIGGGKVGSARGDRPGTQVGSAESGHPTHQSAFDQFESRTTKWIPHDLLFLSTGKAGQTRGERGMGRGGDVVHAECESRVGHESRAQFDGLPGVARMHVDLPRGLDRVVEQGGRGFEDARGDLA